MTALELVMEVRRRGASIEVVDDQLELDGVPGAWRDLLPSLSAQKAEVINTLRAEADASSAPARLDSRPDLIDDSGLWSALLTRAEALDGHDPYGVCGALTGLRALGARLIPSPTGLRLEAYGSYWVDDAAWQADTNKWLRPHLPALRRLLAATTTNQPATAGGTGKG